MADLSDFELINFGGLPTVSPSGTHHLMLDNGATTGKNTIDNIVAAAAAVQQAAAAIATNATNIATNTAAISQLNSNTVSTVFASADTSKYTLNNVRLVRRGSIFVLLGEVKCIAPSTSGGVGIVSSGMPNINGGQVFVPAWGENNASKDALGVQFKSSGVFLTYGTAGGYYELAIPLIML